eukprot:gene4221-gene2694
MQGVVNPARPGPMKKWRLHLKHTTLLDMNAVLQMETARSATKDFLLGVQKFRSADVRRLLDVEDDRANAAIPRGYPASGRDGEV